jgi:hypothetical protein
MCSNFKTLAFYETKIISLAHIVLSLSLSCPKFLLFTLNYTHLNDTVLYGRSNCVHGIVVLLPFQLLFLIKKI